MTASDPPDASAAVQHELGRQRDEAAVGGEFRSGRRALRKPSRYTRAEGRDQHLRQGHPVPRPGGGHWDNAGSQGKPQG